jgi:hypothetical protein
VNHEADNSEQVAFTAEAIAAVTEMGSQEV